MRNTLRLAALLFAAACGSSGDSNSVTNPGDTPTATTSVAITGFAFNPAPIQVAPGAVVTWTNNDNVNHNVTFSSEAIGASPNFSTGTKSLTMPTAAGTYAYHCTIHTSMTGTVKVQ
ncbi:MAG: plastocyanin/azurin family copper-binding protein [bacterium]